MVAPYYYRPNEAHAKYLSLDNPIFDHQEKYAITAEELLLDSFRLGRVILDSGFKPDFLVALWRGGTPIGIAVQELFEYHGVKTDHIAIRTSNSAYSGGKGINVHGLDYIINNANAEDSLLIVDDCHDSGKTHQAVMRRLRKKMRKNFPHDVKEAVVQYKPENNKVRQVPDFFLYYTNKWLVYPHELKGLSKQEMVQFKGKELVEIILGNN